MNAAHPRADERRSAWPNAVLGGLAVLLAVATWQNWAGTALAQSQRATTGMIAGNSEAAVLTCDGGNDDIVLVLDQQSEEVLLYAPRALQALEFKGRYGLRELFAEARVRTGLIAPPAPGTGPGSAPTNPTR